jgi:tryptophan synthase beta chain
VIGREVRRQLSMQPNKLPNLLVARAGDNADAIGFFQPFLPDPRVRLACVQTRSEFTKKGPVSSANDPFKDSMNSSERKVASVIMEGLEYPSVTREHAWFKASGRVEYPEVSEDAVKHIISECGRLEGLIPPIQTAHAIAWACQEAYRMPPDQNVVIALREAMDKDIWEIGKAMGIPL